MNSPLSRTTVILIVLIIISFPIFSFSQSALPLPSYNCNKISSSISIDGLLNEQAWGIAQGVLLNNVISGVPAKYKTVIKLMWDDKYLYLGVFCEDPDVWSTFTKHDDHLWEQDVVEMFIHASEHKYQYFEFGISPNNVMDDLCVLNYRENLKELRPLFEWNCTGIKYSVKVNGTINKRDDVDQSWTCEIAFPLEELWTGLEIPPKNSDVWYMNIFRIDRAKDNQTNADDVQSWSTVGINNGHYPSRFGKLLFKVK